MNFLFKLLLDGLGVYLSAAALNAFFPGVQPVHLSTYLVAIIASICISLVNHTVRPLLKIITFPINVVTLGLFGFIVNGIAIMLVPYLVNLFVPGGFAIQGLWWAVIFSALVSFVQSTLHVLVK